MRLYSLGRSEIEINGSRLTPDAERLFALAIYLIAARGRPVPRSELTQLLWPEARERLASHSLRQAVYRLRHLGALIATSRSDLQIAPDSAWADYFALLDARSDDEPLPTGAFLPGYEPRFSDRLRTWIEQQRSIVHSALRRRQVHAISVGRQRGDWAAVERIAHACLEIDCLNEEATFALAEAAVMHGSKSRGLQILDHYLKEIGPGAREMRIPAVTLRNRIARSELSPVSAGRIVPFVGRREYLERLNAALALAVSSHGSLQFIWGEPGIGKTRLVREFIDAAKLQDVQVVVANVQSSDQSRPLSCFLDLLPVLLSMPGSLGCSPETLQTLHVLCGRAQPALRVHDADPREISARNRSAILELLDCVAEEQCLVVFVEDAHWADLLSQELLQDISNWVSSRSLLVILTSRNRDLVDLWRRFGVNDAIDQELVPLSDAESRALMTSLRSITPVPIDPVEEESYISASGGNPYHLTELMIRRVQDGEAAQLESSLAALIKRRFDRLRPESLRVLQGCAVLGKYATLGRLREVLQLRSSEFLDALDELDRHALLESTAQEMRCKHDIVAAVATAQLGHASRRLLHLNVARVLDQERIESASPGLLWDAAEHWLEAGEHDHAIRTLRECAVNARQIGSPMEAARVLRRALELRQDLQSRNVLLREYAQALEQASLWPDLVAALEEIRLLNPERHGLDQHDAQELLLLEARRRCGTDPRVILGDLWKCIESTSAPPHRVRAASAVLQICDNICDAVMGRQAFEAVAADRFDASVSIEGRLELELIYYCSFGDVAQSAAVARDWIRLAHERPNDSGRTRVLLYGGVALSYAGFQDEARARLVDAFQLASKQELHHLAGAVAHELAGLAFRRGELAESRNWATEAVRRCRRIPLAFGLPAALMMSVSVAICTGEYADAERWLIELEDDPVIKYYGRARAWVVGYRLWLNLRHKGETPKATQLETFLHHFHLTRAFVGMDQLAVIVFELLCAADRTVEAQQAVREYVDRYRRDRTPLLPALEALIAGPN